MTLLITPPTHHTKSMSSISQLLLTRPNLDETLNVGSLEQLEQIPMVTVTFVHETFVLATSVHIRNMLLTQL